MRDFYDVYILNHTRKSDISDSVLGNAFARTVQKRGSDFLLRENLGQAVQTLKDSPELHKLWERYQKKYAYACDIPWQDAVDSVLELTNGISMTEQQDMDMKMEF